MDAEDCIKIVMKRLQTSVKYNSIQFGIDKSSIIIYTQASSLINRDIMVYLINQHGIELNNKRYSFTSEIRYILPTLPNGIYSLNMMVRPLCSQVYWSYFHKHDILINVSNSKIEFISPIITIRNSLKFSALIRSANFINLALGASSSLQVNDYRIKRLAKELAKNHFFSYSKVLAVHNWVTENIYYDLDSLKSENYKYNDASAVATLLAKKGVCQGISNLSIAILRAMGIPAYGLICFALGISTEGGWERSENLLSPANHQITIAYIDNRWMFMDVTWDSDNIYENGMFRQKTGLGISHKYFDNTITFLSNTHRFII